MCRYMYVYKYVWYAYVCSQKRKTKHTGVPPPMEKLYDDETQARMGWYDGEIDQEAELAKVCVCVDICARHRMKTRSLQTEHNVVHTVL